MGAPPPRKDTRRPNLPYHEGLELIIHPHNPPYPFGNLVGFVDENVRERVGDQDELRKMTHSEWCLTHPLIETPPHPSRESTRKLRVTSKIAIGDRRGAQVVRCFLDEDETKEYVAKIYDPLYYEFSDELGPEYCCNYFDCTWKADYDYSREALCYQKLTDFGLDGKFTPKFYGCWTFDMLLPGEHAVNRPARLILMEHIQGVSMHQILTEDNIDEITPENRLNIYAKVLEADTTLDFHGITHNDLSPRNVMLLGPYKGNAMPKIRLIDFNHATIDVPLNSEHLKPEQRSIKPVSPRYHHWGPPNEEFGPWIPNPMRKIVYFKGWLKKQWGNKNKEFGGPSVFKKGDTAYNQRVKYEKPRDNIEPRLPRHLPR